MRVSFCFYKKKRLFNIQYLNFFLKRSCWAFAAIGTLEPAIFKKTGQTISLSEQHLVDCTYPTDGCKSGNAWTAFSYLKNVGSSYLQSSYPVRSLLEYYFLRKFPKISIFFKYTSIKSWSGSCKSKTLNSSSIGYNTSQLRIVGTKNKSEAWLQQAVADIGPIAVSFTMTRNFFIYKSGVYFESDCG